MVHTVWNLVASFLDSEILCFNGHLQVATLDTDASVSEARALHGLVEVDNLIRRNREAANCALGNGRGGITRAQFLLSVCSSIILHILHWLAKKPPICWAPTPTRTRRRPPIAATSHDRRTLRQRVSAHG